MVCHRAAVAGPRHKRSPEPFMANVAAVDGPPETKYGCYRWFTFAASSPPVFFSPVQFLVQCSVIENRLLILEDDTN